MMKEDLRFNCALEPDDDRNFILTEDFTTSLSFTVQHVAYGFWYRIKCAIRLLFTGVDTNDITISSDNAESLAVWLNEWVKEVKEGEE